MTRPENRVAEAGADVLRIAETRVLVVSDEAHGLPWEHPAPALCRGLAALGFGEIGFCGSEAQAYELERLTPGLGLRRWSLGEADLPFDLVLHLGGSPFTLEESADRATSQGSHWLAISQADTHVSMRTREALEGGDEPARDAPALAPIARIGAGLALQEALIFAGQLGGAAAPAPVVSFEADGDWHDPWVEDAIVDVIGAGALSVHLLESLAPALGRSELRIFDFDRVSPVNLPIQPAFRHSDVGRPKALALAERIEPFCDPETKVVPMDMRYEDRPSTLAAPSLRIACPDTFAARKYLNDCALADGIPLVEAASSPLAAQQRSYLPGRTACLEHQIRDLAGRARGEDDRGSCALERAVTLPGANMVAGGMLALAALRALDPERFGAPSQGTHTYDARFPARLGVVAPRPACEHGQASYTPRD